MRKDKICFDCQNGVSGDMLVGAMLDLGADEKLLKNAILSLKLSKFTIKIEKILKKGVFCTDFNVKLKDENFDHDMKMLFGDKKLPQIVEKRTIVDVFKILDNSELTENAKKMAKEIFSLIAKAEGKAHGVPEEEVVFHENGAMDSIIDIVSCAVLLDDLNAEVFAKNLCEGHGFIQTHVGKLPIPTPAVKNICQICKLKLVKKDIEAELITPTGLAVLACTAKFETPQAEKVRSGFGAGKRDYDTPCVLEAQLLR